MYVDLGQRYRIASKDISTHLYLRFLDHFQSSARKALVHSSSILIIMMQKNITDV